MVLPSFVRAALAGKAADGLRRRHAVALLLPRQRHRRSARETDRTSRARWARSSTSAARRRSPSSELARLVKFMTRSASPIQYIPYDQAYEAGFEDMQRRVPDTSKTKKPGRFPDHPRYAAGRAKRHRLFQRAGKTPAHNEEGAGDAGGEGLADDLLMSRRWRPSAAYDLNSVERFERPAIRSEMTDVFSLG